MGFACFFGKGFDTDFVVALTLSVHTRKRKHQNAHKTRPASFSFGKHPAKPGTYTHHKPEPQAVDARIGCLCNRCGKRPIQDTRLIDIEPRSDSSQRVYDGCNSRIGCTRHRNALLDCAGARNQQMLRRSSPGTKPRIIRNVYEPPRSGRADHGAGKENLITNQRA